MIKNLEQYPIVREDIGWTPEKLIRFEERIVEHWSNEWIKRVELYYLSN